MQCSRNNNTTCLFLYYSKVGSISIDHEQKIEESVQNSNSMQLCEHIFFSAVEKLFYPSSVRIYKYGVNTQTGGEIIRQEGGAKKDPGGGISGGN